MLEKQDIIRLRAIRLFISSNLDKELKLLSIAERFFVSIPTLRRHFRNYYRVPLHSFILRKRMQKALQLLKENDIPLKTIAKQVGYKRYTSFIHTFSKYHGFSPSQITQLIERVNC